MELKTKRMMAMKNKKRFLLLLMIIVLILESLSFGAVAQHQEPNLRYPLKIGAILPLSGHWEILGQNGLGAIKALLEIMRSYNLGIDIEVEILDSESHPEKALENLVSLKERGAQIVIGPMTSDEALYVQEYALENAMLLISPTATSSELSKHKHIIRLSPSDKRQSDALIYAMNGYGIADVVIIHIDDAYGNSLYRDFKTSAALHGMNVLPAISLCPQEPDYKQALLELEDRVAGRPKDSTAILLLESEIRGADLIRCISKGSSLDQHRWFVGESIAGSLLFAEDMALASFAINASMEGFAMDYEMPLHDVIYEIENFLSQSSYTQEFSFEEPIYHLEDLEGDPFSDDGLAYDDVAHHLESALFNLIGHERPHLSAGLPLLRYSIAERLEGPFHMSSYLTWDALYLVAHAHKRNPMADSELFRERLIEESKRYINAFNVTNPFDEFGDITSAYYSNLQFEELASGYGWRYKGTYFQSPQGEPRIINIGAKASYTEDQGRVMIGALLPLTGQWAEIGQEAERVLSFAVHVANAFLAHHAPGLSMDLQILDTATDPKRALSAIEDLYNQGFRVFVGPYTSAELGALQGFTEKKNVILISPASTAPSLGEMDRVIRLAMADSAQVQALLLLMERKDIEQVILLYRDDIYGQELALALAAAFEGSAHLLPYDPSDFDPKSLVQRAEELAADPHRKTGILSVSFSEILSILRAVPGGSPLLAIPWFGADGTACLEAFLEDEEIASLAAKVEFTSSTFSYYGDKYLSFIPTLNAHLSSMDRELSAYGINTYDAFWFLTEAIIQVGLEAIAPEIWAHLTNNQSFLGIGGLFGINEQGDRSTGSFLFYTLLEEEGEIYWEQTGVYDSAYMVIQNLPFYE